MSDFKQFHHVSEGGTCAVCGQPATHKIGEEISPWDPELGTVKFESGLEMKQHRHNFTGHVCCTHFRMLFGDAVFCPESPQILADIMAERERQDAQWGGSEHDDAHTQDDWSLFIRHFADKAENAENDDEYRRRMIQIAALAVAAIESLDRYHRKG